MRRYFDCILGAGLASFGLLGAVGLHSLPWAQSHPLGIMAPQIVPLLLFVLLILLGAGLVAAAALNPHYRSIFERPQARGVLAAGALLMFPLLVPLIGFVISAALLGLCVLWLTGVRHWAKLVLTPVLTAVIIVKLAELTLRVSFP